MRIEPIILTEADLDDGDLPADEPDRSLDASVHYASALANAHDARWRMRSGQWRWDADLNLGTLTFSNESAQKLVAPVQVVGTFSPSTGTWLWGWDHPSVPLPLRAHAELVRQFGEQYGLEAFTTRMIQVTEEDAWQFAELASYLGKSQGVYRGLNRDVQMYMSFGELTAG